MMSSQSQLYEILINKKKEVVELRSRFPLSKIVKAVERNVYSDATRNFKKVISQPHHINIIGEIKKASPSEGVIKDDFNALKIAEIYEYTNIKAISVLTEMRYFKGRVSYLKTVRKITTKPILRKDFIIDRYQIYESALYSADAVLLIAAILTDEELKNYINELRQLNIAALVEIHNQHDLHKALDAGAEIIGINNRNLNTFKIDLAVTERLIRYIPKDKAIISESGLSKKEDMHYLKSMGVNAFLIGTHFMRSHDMLSAINEITS